MKKITKILSVILMVPLPTAVVGIIIFNIFVVPRMPGPHGNDFILLIPEFLIALFSLILFPVGALLGKQKLYFIGSFATLIFIFLLFLRVISMPHAIELWRILLILLGCVVYGLVLLSIRFFFGGFENNA